MNRHIENHKQGLKFESKYEQSKALNAIKKEQFPWMMEANKGAVQYALWNLEDAFKNLFKRKKEGKSGGFPRFKSRHATRESFKLGFDQLKYAYITNSTVKIPKIKTTWIYTITK